MTEREWDDVGYDEPTPEIEEAPPLEPPKPKAKLKGGFLVMAVQSAVCAVLLGLALTVRMMDGAGAWWRGEVREALGDNRIVEWVFGGWQGETGDASEEPPAALPESALPSAEPKTGLELPFSSDPVGASAVYQMVVEPVEQTAAVRRELPLPNCLPLLTGVLTSGYGEREHPVSGEDSFHTGWDIAAEEGTPIAAMYDATVSETGSGGSYANYVEMRVNEHFSFLYAHCSQVLVSEGDIVTAGQTVALVGSTGSLTTGEHLHFELWHRGEAVDPAIYISC